ncbi:MAG: nicotinate-nucleotide adenylyltransferase [Chloroflexi bacterium]|nr:nicotinate-nucleotide adenylyltransferase [Chloroflexota bacterium]
MRIGILGGTFDPIHFGHLAIAEECRARLNLDRVLFMPAADPPHKQGVTISPIQHRVAMVETAIANKPAFAITRVDVDRPGPSFTVHALEVLRHEWGPAAQLWLLMGADSLAELLTWREPERIITLARLVVTNRPGLPTPDPHVLEVGLPGASARIDIVEIPPLGISGSDLRQRVAEGRPIACQVPEAVERYIEAHGLYRREDAGS